MAPPQIGLRTSRWIPKSGAMCSSTLAGGFFQGEPPTKHSHTPHGHGAACGHGSQLVKPHKNQDKRQSPETVLGLRGSSRSRRLQRSQGSSGSAPRERKRRRCDRVPELLGIHSSDHRRSPSEEPNSASSVRTGTVWGGSWAPRWAFGGWTRDMYGFCPKELSYTWKSLKRGMFTMCEHLL